MATIMGRNAVVYLQGSGSEGIVLTEAAEWSLDVDRDREPDPAFGDVWETQLGGLLRFSGAIAGNYDNAQSGNSVWESCVASSSRKMYLYPDRATLTNYYYGNVWPTLGIAIPLGRGTFSLSFVGDGQLALKP